MKVDADGRIEVATVSEALELQRARRRRPAAGPDERHIERAGGGYRYRINQCGRALFGPTRATWAEAETDYQAALTGHAPARAKVFSAEWAVAVSSGIKRAWERRRAAAGPDAEIRIPLRTCRLCGREGHDRRTCPERPCHG